MIWFSVLVACWFLQQFIAFVLVAVRYDRGLAKQQREIKESLEAMRLDPAYAHAWAVLEALHYGDPTPEELAIRELLGASGIGHAVPLMFGTHRVAPLITGTLKRTAWLDEIEHIHNIERTYTGGM